MIKIRFLAFFILFPFLGSAQVVKNLKQDKKGVNITMSDGTLGIYPLSENAVRILNLFQ